MNFKATNNIAGFFSSVATVGAFLLALYAYFFTDIPEELVAKFNSEISALNQEVDSLEKEKKFATLQLNEVKEELIAQRDNLERLNIEKSQLEQKMSKTLEEVEQQKKYRIQYLADNVSAIFGANFTGTINDATRELERDAELAATLIEFINSKDVKIRKPEYSWVEKLFSPNTVASNEVFWKSKEIDLRIDSMPRPWLRESFYQRSTRDNPKSSTESLRERLAQEKSPITGLDILNAALKDKEIIISTMPVEDRAKVKEALELFLESNTHVLSKRLNLDVPLSANNQEVVESGTSISKNIKAFKALVLKMPQDLSRIIKSK